MDEIYGIFLVLGVLGILFYWVPFIWVLKKAGWNSWNVIYMLIPFVNFFFILIFAFSDWPICTYKKYLNQRKSKK